MIESFKNELVNTKAKASNITFSVEVTINFNTKLQISYLSEKCDKKNNHFLEKFLSTNHFRNWIKLFGYNATDNQCIAETSDTN